MKKRILFIVFFLVCVSPLTVKSQMKALSLSMKVEHATHVFEGKVISKTSFWNGEHTLLFTANKVEVCKVFKGNINSTEVEIITEGGTIGNDMQDASESLALHEGSMGMFLAELSTIEHPEKNKTTVSLKPYGGVQGFIKYDLNEKSAMDAFVKYENIKTDLYQPIMNQTGEQFKILKSNSLDSLEALPSQKKCFWSRWFKCKKK